ncbi:MAG: hypothetical protein IK051_01255 [Rhodocyclaceae bacterium]|nr:hypothetical protein [Rhodocyclaceae bacterium]
MHITNYWLTLHLNGKRVVVAPGAELPAGVPEAEIRALLASGVIRQADAAPKPAKPAKSKPKTEAEQ